jgi:chromosome segregation ATPase
MMLYTGEMDGEQTPMEDAESQLYRRIQELRARARGLDTGEQPPPQDEAPLSSAAAADRPQVPDLRTLLARTESHVDELRATASALESRLPAQVERAIERAMAAHGDERHFDELRDALTAIARQIDQVNRDLLAERLGRVEDLELVVDLISTGMAEMRKDSATLAAMLERVGGGVDTVLDRMDQPLQVTVERPQHAGVRDLFTPTDDPTPAGSPGSGAALP